MDINDMKVGDVLALAKILGGAKEKSAVVNHDLQIVILDRGFVYVGKVSTDDNWMYISDAKNVRIWGTTKGLGELVDGPLPGTKVDLVGIVKCPIRAVIGMIECRKGW